MSESFIKYRLKFKRKGVQQTFLNKAQKVLDLSCIEFSKKLQISQRTLSDWKREKFFIPQDTAIQIENISKTKVPEQHIVIDSTERLKKIGKIGGKNKFVKHGNVGGDEIHRKKKWIEWWEKIGRHNERGEGYKKLLQIKKPPKSEKLAEFTGIMLGDGGIAPYHIHITLSNKETEFVDYINKLIVHLFGLKPKLYKLKYARAIDLVVQRKELVDFCLSIGLVKGNKTKQQIDIPSWIKENNNFLRECIRGLVDTDGCFYVNAYKVNTKRYSYLKICFISASIPLVNSFSQSLEKFGIKNVIDKKKRDVRIVETDSVNKYIDQFGTHNAKHLKKIIKWKKAKI